MAFVHSFKLMGGALLFLYVCPNMCCYEGV